MKYIPALVLLVLALLACNLTKRLSSNSNSASTGGETAERPVMTAAQTQALAGGQTVTWHQQGVSLTLPKGSNKMDVDSKQFNYGAPRNKAVIIASISLI